MKTLVSKTSPVPCFWLWIKCTQAQSTTQTEYVSPKTLRRSLAITRFVLIFSWSLRARSHTSPGSEQVVVKHTAYDTIQWNLWISKYIFTLTIISSRYIFKVCWVHSKMFYRPAIWLMWFVFPAKLVKGLPFFSPT